jgi:hypothetical protein
LMLRTFSTGSPESTVEFCQPGSVRHTIPERLDSAAQLLDDALDLGARYGLAEALQPDPHGYAPISEGLRAAANRIRAAGDQIPDAHDWSPQLGGGDEPGRGSPCKGASR